jgi:DNA-binding winged helix-turn-helix (wHTH) protein
VLARPLSAQALRDALARVLKSDARLPDTMQVGEVQLDRQRLEVRSNGSRVTLTPTQFKVIQCLAEQQGAIVTTEDLLRAVWGERRTEATPELLRSHLHTLRERLRGVAGERLIENVPHRGYRIAC